MSMLVGIPLEAVAGLRRADLRFDHRSLAAHSPDGGIRRRLRFLWYCSFVLNAIGDVVLCKKCVVLWRMSSTIRVDLGRFSPETSLVGVDGVEHHLGVGEGVVINAIRSQQLSSNDGDRDLFTELCFPSPLLPTGDWSDVWFREGDDSVLAASDILSEHPFLLFEDGGDLSVASAREQGASFLHQQEVD
jgi:hypothetical protein